MTKKNLYVVTILMALTIMPIFYAHGETQTLTNVGFIQGNIWYSEEPFFDGDHIRIYTVLHNNSGQDITGTIVFYDNETPINSNNFSIANERVQDQWTDWQAVYGSHKISASITNAKMILPGGALQLADRLDDLPHLTRNGEAVAGELALGIDHALQHMHHVDQAAGQRHDEHTHGDDDQNGE